MKITFDAVDLLGALIWQELQTLGHSPTAEEINMQMFQVMARPSPWTAAIKKE